MRARFALISGVPTAGKSSLCDKIEASEPGFTHIPLDRYIKPIPESRTFLDWVRTPSCIAWARLREHIRILESGRICFSPKPAFDGRRGEWISGGGLLEAGPGRRMAPAQRGCLIAGTHSFAFAADVPSALLVFLSVTDRTVAERLTGEEHDETSAAEIVRERLGTNPEVIRHMASQADLVIPGTGPRSDQVSQFLGGFNSSEC